MLGPELKIQMPRAGARTLSSGSTALVATRQACFTAFLNPKILQKSKLAGVVVYVTTDNCDRNKRDAEFQLPPPIVCAKLSWTGYGVEPVPIIFHERDDISLIQQINNSLFESSRCANHRRDEYDFIIFRQLRIAGMSNIGQYTTQLWASEGG